MVCAWRNAKSICHDNGGYKKEQSLSTTDCTTMVNVWGGLSHRLSAPFEKTHNIGCTGLTQAKECTFLCFCFTFGKEHKGEMSLTSKNQH